MNKNEKHKCDANDAIYKYKQFFYSAKKVEQ